MGRKINVNGITLWSFVHIIQRWYSFTIQNIIQILDLTPFALARHGWNHYGILQVKSTRPLKLFILEQR